MTFELMAMKVTSSPRSRLSVAQAIQLLAGHSSIRLTFDIYGKWFRSDTDIQSMALAWIVGAWQTGALNPGGHP